MIEQLGKLQHAISHEICKGAWDVKLFQTGVKRGSLTCTLTLLNEDTMPTLRSFVLSPRFAGLIMPLLPPTLAELEDILIGLVK